MAAHSSLSQREPQASRMAIHLKVWRRLTEPAPAIRDQELRRRARLLSSILLWVVPLPVLATVLRLAVDPAFQLSPVAAGGPLVLIAAYGLSRTRLFSWAAAMTVLVFPVAIFSIVITSYNPSSLSALLAYLVLGVLLASVLFSMRGTIILIVANFIVMLLLPLLIPDLVFARIVSPLTFMILTSIAVVVTMHYRNQLEIDRRAVGTSKERFRMMLEHSPDGVVLLDPHDENVSWPIIYCNPVYAEMNGYAREALIGQSIDVLHSLPEAPVELQAHFDDRVAYLERLRREGTVQIEVKHLDKSGKTVFVAVSTRLVEVDGQELVMGIDHDITEIKQVDEALRVERDFAESLVETAQAIILVLDSEGRIVRFNSYMEQMSGYRLEEVQGKEWVATFIPERDRDHIRRMFQRAVGDVQTEGNVNSIVTKDGDEREIEWYDRTLKDADGNTLGLLAVGIDVTERVRAKQALQQYAKRLEVLRRIDKGILAARAPEAIAGATMRHIHKLMPCQRASVTLFDFQSGEYWVLAAHVQGDSRFEEGAHAPLETFGGDVETLREGRPYIVEDVASLDSPPAAVQTLQDEGLRAYMSVPLIAAEALLGTLNIGMESAGAFSPERVSIVQEVAGQLAIAIHNSQLREAEQQQRITAEALRDSAIAAVSSLKLDEVLDRILESIGHVVPHEAASVMLVENGTARIVKRRGRADHVAADSGVGASFDLEETTNLKRMADSGEVLIINDTRDYEGWVELPPFRWVRAYAGAPLSVGGKVIGFLNLQSGTPGAFSEVNVEGLQAFAAQTAVAIRNAQLYSQIESYNETLEETVAVRTRQLERSRTRAETILDSVGEGVLVVSPDGKIQQVNPALEEQTGYSAQELAGQPPRSFIPVEPALEARYMEPLAAIESQLPWRGELPILRKDGDIFEAAVTVAPVRSGNGELRGSVVSLRDISAQKELARMKDAFVSNVSHQLRTPITGIKLYLTLLEHGLLEDVIDPEVRDEYVPTLKREVERLNRIIEDVLQLSRLDQDRVEMELAPVDLNALAEQYVADRQPLAENRDLTLSFEGRAGLPTVEADKGLLSQVLSVLLTNALHYTPAGGEVTTTTQVNGSDGTQWVGFSVSDTGPGIPPEEQGQLFERFFRGQVGRESDAPGTGLGLSIAREIVDRHGGRIEVESEGLPGKGTTFRVWFPSGR